MELCIQSIVWLSVCRYFHVAFLCAFVHFCCWILALRFEPFVVVVVAASDVAECFAWLSCVCIWFACVCVLSFSFFLASTTRYAVATGIGFVQYLVFYAIAVLLYRYSRFFNASVLAKVTAAVWDRTPEAMRGAWVVASTLIGSLMFEKFRMSMEFGAIFIGVVFARVGGCGVETLCVLCVCACINTSANSQFICRCLNQMPKANA